MKRVIYICPRCNAVQEFIIREVHKKSPICGWIYCGTKMILEDCFDLEGD
jgi:hypothetical protein